MKVKFPLQHLNAAFAGSTANAERRTVELDWYSGAAVDRYNWWTGDSCKLTLSMSPEHVRLGRLRSGNAPLLNSHRDYDLKDILGVIESARIENGIGKAVVRFSDRPDAEVVYRDVKAAIIRNASVGLAVFKLKETTKEGDKEKSYLAVDWEPREVSVVAVPADAGAGFRLAAGNSAEMTDCEILEGSGENIMLNSETTQETADQSTDARVQEIQKLAKAAKLDAAFATEHIEGGSSVEQVRRAVFDQLAERSERAPTRCHHTMQISRDHREGLVESMSEALALRFTGGQPSERAREFVGARLSDLAKECLVANGVSTRGTYSSPQLIKLAMSTSDFPELLTGTGQRMLLQAYTAAAPPIKEIARRSTVDDFRTKSLLRLGEAPRLLKVNEGGEIKHGARTELKESYRAYTYARMYALTREALVNDDLGAFADFFAAFGVAAASLEAESLTAVLTSNPLMSDGTALFDTTHQNLITPGTAISVDNLGIARKTLRLQTSLDGQTIISTTPKFLVVPAAKETLAEQNLAAINPTATNDVNPFGGGKLTLIVDPLLDASSTTAWYIFSDPAATPTVEYSYLSGAEGPQIESRPGWQTLGAEFRCYEDFGVGAIGTRGVVKNLGA